MLVNLQRPYSAGEQGHRGTYKGRREGPTRSFSPEGRKEGPNASHPTPGTLIKTEGKRKRREVLALIEKRLTAQVTNILKCLR